MIALGIADREPPRPDHRGARCNQPTAAIERGGRGERAHLQQVRAQGAAIPARLCVRLHLAFGQFQLQGQPESFGCSGYVGVAQAGLPGVRVDEEKFLLDSDRRRSRTGPLQLWPGRLLCAHT